jgi:hypothetical protein
MSDTRTESKDVITLFDAFNDFIDNHRMENGGARAEYQIDKNRVAICESLVSVRVRVFDPHFHSGEQIAHFIFRVTTDSNWTLDNILPGSYEDDHYFLSMIFNPKPTQTTQSALQSSS